MSCKAPRNDGLENRKIPISGFPPARCWFFEKTANGEVRSPRSITHRRIWLTQIGSGVNRRQAGIRPRTVTRPWSS